MLIIMTLLRGALLTVCAEGEMTVSRYDIAVERRFAACNAPDAEAIAPAEDGRIGSVSGFLDRTPPA